jgi:CDP-glucose 4,6-dehydratase
VTNTLGKTLQNLPGPVLITGHTGFKGTWMTLLLQQLGISVVGYSLKPEKDSLYDRAKLKGQIPEKFADIRNYQKLEKFILKHQPSVIIHMAAQPLVLESYETPRETFDVNVMGTVNLLDIAFSVESVQVLLVVTTDKVYRNDDSGQSFVESDPLAGKDPYSASKVGAEAAVNAWQQIAGLSGGPKVVSARAGNVIGGGDFAINRLIPDLVRSHISGETLVIRNPSSSRPWQHVLDLLYGYLLVIEATMVMNSEIRSVNFGPDNTVKNQTTLEVVETFSNVWPDALNLYIEKKIRSSLSKEVETLGIDSTFARTFLKWQNQYSQLEAIEASANWWKKVLIPNSNALEISQSEITQYLNRLYMGNHAHS